MKKLVKIVLPVFVLLASIGGRAQTITVSTTTSPCFSPSACPVTITMSETPAVGSVKLKLKFLRDSSSAYYANMDTITYIIDLKNGTNVYSLLINPGVIGRATLSVGTAIVNYVAATINTTTNFYDSSKSLRKGKYFLTAEYQRTSNSAIVSTTSSLRWDLNNITLPPQVLSPITGKTVGNIMLFKGKLYDTSITSGSKKIIIYKNATRTLVSTLVLDDLLADSFNVKFNHLSDNPHVVSVSGQDSLADDTYKLLYYYQDGRAHVAAADSVVITLKTSTTPPTLVTAKNTIFNAANPNGPISYMLPDSSNAALLTLTNISDGSSPVSFPLSSTSRITQSYTLPTGQPATDGKYQVVVSYQDYLGNPAASVTDTVIFQRKTARPLITQPVNWQTLNNPIIIKDSIAGTILPGSKMLTISGLSKTGMSTVLTFQLADTQKDSVYYDGTTNPAANGTVVSMTSSTGSTVLPDGNYQITIAYSDIYGNTTARSLPVNFIFKTLTQPPVLWSPITSSVNGNSLTVSYSLPDSLRMANSVVLVFSNTNGADSLFLHPDNTTSNQSFTWLTNTNPATIGGSPVSAVSPALPNGIASGTYSVTLSYRDVLGNPAASVTNSAVSISNSSARARFVLPASNSTVVNQFILKDTIGATSISGTKTINFTQSNIVKSTITLANNPVDSFALNVHHLSTNTPNVIANTGLDSLPDGNYTMILTYQDVFGNPSSSDTIAVSFDTHTSIPVLASPVSNSSANRPMLLGFTLPETPKPNTVLVVVATATHSDTLHLSTSTSGTFNYTFDTKNIRANPIVISSTTNSLDSGVYTVQLFYQDFLSNMATSASNQNIYIGNGRPVISNTRPLTFCFGDSTVLTSSAMHGNQWYLDDVAIDTTASIVAKNAGLYRLVSTFDNVSFTGYTSQSSDPLLVGVKQAPNSPATQNISYYVQDTIATALSANMANGNTLRWYGTDSAGGSITTLAPIPRTSVAGNFSYYVSQYNSATGCESARSALIVSIVPLPPGVDKNGKVGSKQALQKNGQIIEVIRNGN